jgi:diacylglycerol kinase (ATP)
VTRVAVLRNPTAGRGRHAESVADALSALTSPQRTVEILDARTVDGALAAARAAVAEGVAALVAVGGDGTVHLGLQAVAGTGVPLGVIPAGTGNDFARECGLPVDPVLAAQRLTHALDTGASRPVDLARIAGPAGYAQWFGAVLAAGFDAIVNERANAMAWPRGRRRYDIAILAELLRLRPRRYRLTLDGETTELDAVLVAVGNTASYGGGLRMCPRADPTDSLLDVVVGGPISRATLLRLKPRLFHGTHVDHPAVRYLRAREVTLQAEGITAYADGERTCPLPITVTAHPAALTLLT